MENEQITAGVSDLPEKQVRYIPAYRYAVGGEWFAGTMRETPDDVVKFFQHYGSSFADRKIITVLLPVL